MIDPDLLRHLEALGSAQRLELIAHLWDLLDRHGLPATDSVTLILDEAPAAQRPRTLDVASRFPPSTVASPGSSPPAPA